MTDSISFRIITGLSGNGYVPEREIGKVWQKLALDEYHKSAIYISATICRSVTVYSMDSGCPEGGQNTYIITGGVNIQSHNQFKLWCKSLKNIIKDLRVELNQSTISLEIYKPSIWKFEDKKSNRERIIEEIESMKFSVDSDQSQMDNYKDLLKILKGEDPIDITLIEQIGICPGGLLDDYKDCSESEGEYKSEDCIACWKKVLIGE